MYIGNYALSISAGSLEVTGGTAAGGDGYGLYTGTGLLSASGSGSLTATGGTASAADKSSFGVRSRGNVTIDTTGTVTVSSGAASGSGGASYGWRVDGTSTTLDVKKGAVTIQANGGCANYALDAENNEVKFEGTANVTVTTGNAAAESGDADSIGIVSDKGSINNSAQVRVSAGTAPNESYGWHNKGTGASDLEIASKAEHPAVFTCDAAAHFLPVDSFKLVVITAVSAVNKDGSGTQTQYEIGENTIAENTNKYFKAPGSMTPYNVTFDANSGSGTQTAGTTTGTYTLPACTFTAPAGKQFKAWALGNASGTQYDAGASVTGIAADTTFYAVWQDIPTAPVAPVIVTPPVPVVTEIDSGDTTTGTNVTALVSQNKTLTVKADDGATAIFDTTALRGIDSATTGDVTVTLTDVTSSEPETAAAAAAATAAGATTAPATTAGSTDTTAAAAAAAATSKVYTLDVSSSNKTVENYGGTVTVTLPYTPDFNPKRVTVYEKTEDGTLEKRADATYDSATGTVTLTDDGDSTTYVVSSKPFPFTDVKTTDYYYDAVDWAELTEVAKGVTETTFAPNADTTRAQTVTFLWRAAGSPEPKTTANPFNDIDPAYYYYKAVLWAAENGITLGDGAGSFNPDGVVTRAQLVAFLYRLIQMNGGGFTGEWAFPLDFADASDVPEWAYEAFCYLTMNGIVQGSDGKLLPLDDCLRGQIMTMLYRYFAED